MAKKCEFNKRQLNGDWVKDWVKLKKLTLNLIEP